MSFLHEISDEIIHCEKIKERTCNGSTVAEMNTRISMLIWCRERYIREQTCQSFININGGIDNEAAQVIREDQAQYAEGGNQDGH